jgi:RNA polymerase sigma-70 factor (ECF subfamily)
MGLARGHLHAQLLHRVDPEDVVQSAYKSFVHRYGEEALDTHRLDGLWGLLALITVRKCADRVRHYQAGCRDMAREAGASPDGGSDAWREASDREPTPDEAAVLAETLEQLLADLGEDERAMIELSLQGYSTREVSEQLGRAERSVRRVRERVKRRLERM